MEVQEPAVSSSDQPKTLNDPSISEKQEARAFLRERFIRAVMSLSGKPGAFSMYENTNVKATFGSSDREFMNIHVRSLQTPIGPLPNAVLRTNDMVSIHFSDINPSS